MIFCDIVSKISGDRSPIVAEFALSLLAAEPVEMHIHGLESIARNVIGYYAQSCWVIGLNMCGGLFATYFIESIPCWDGLAAIYEEVAEFCFRCR